MLFALEEYANKGDNMRYQEINGNMFDSVPSETLLLHACNCWGNWGKGIALEFAKRFPEAYSQHKEYCNSKTTEELLNTSQIILPSKVVCLFTSRGFGKQKGTIREILESTRRSLVHLFDQEFSNDIIKIRAPRINAGLFCVPWENTKSIIMEVISKQQKEVEWTTFIL